MAYAKLNYQPEAFNIVSRLAMDYATQIEQFRQVFGVDACWLGVDTSGDVWLYTVKPVFHQEPNQGYWVMPYRRSIKRQSYRLARIELPSILVSPHALTEVVA